jgi:hypothetical protein
MVWSFGRSLLKRWVTMRRRIFSSIAAPHSSSFTAEDGKTDARCRYGHASFGCWRRAPVYNGFLFRDGLMTIVSSVSVDLSLLRSIFAVQGCQASRRYGVSGGP